MHLSQFSAAGMHFIAATYHPVLSGVGNRLMHSFALPFEPLKLQFGGDGQETYAPPLRHLSPLRKKSAGSADAWSVWISAAE